MGENLMIKKIFYSRNFSQSRTYYMRLSLCSYQIRLKWQRLLPWSSHTWEATKDVWADAVGEELVWRKENFHDIYAVSVMKDTVASSLATCPRKYCLLFHCYLLKMDWFCVESWEEDVKHWCAHVLKCFYIFQSFKFLAVTKFLWF